LKKFTIVPLMTVCATPMWGEELPHVDQADLNALGTAAFEHAFEAGDELTEHSFDAEGGVGANIGEGRRFTRFPRADLDGPTEWANHFPMREGGANATSCIACHNAPFANGAGDIALNVVVDPAHTGDPSFYLERNTLPLFALGIPQRLAEEISLALFEQRDTAISLACDVGVATTALTAKGVDYGVLEMTRTSLAPCDVDVDSSGLIGIDDDLVIRAFGWKGNVATIREFTRGAAHNELGLQAVEIVGDQDGDFDGVTQELTVGDMTALTIYMAGLERPVNSVELAELGLVEMDTFEIATINAGEATFHAIGCNSCHTSEMSFDNPQFSEPSNVQGFYDFVFPDGSEPEAHGLTQKTAITFDLTSDQPNNQIETANGVYHLGALNVNANGQAIANWYTDFRRHNLGNALADPSDPLGIGAGMFLTRSLAGVGDTGPWLHDGRATTLHEAIITHGGDAQTVTEAYMSISPTKQAELISFLESLTYYQSSGE
jgi:hypothetical protein